MIHYLQSVTSVLWQICDKKSYDPRTNSCGATLLVSTQSYLEQYSMTQILIWYIYPISVVKVKMAMVEDFYRFLP